MIFTPTKLTSRQVTRYRKNGTLLIKQEELDNNNAHHKAVLDYTVNITDEQVKAFKYKNRFNNISSIRTTDDVKYYLADKALRN